MTYVATYLERDVRNALNVADLEDFGRFLRAVAIRTGRMLSYADLARDVGVAPNTAKKWTSVLAASGQVYLLEPYHRNLGKRLIKTPKIYLTDTGLAIYLMGFSNPNDGLESPLSGEVWETHVVNQILRRFDAAGRPPPLWYWRTPHGREVDVLIEEGGGTFTAVECKMAEHPGADAAAGIEALRDFYGEKNLKRAFIACRTTAPYEVVKGVRAVEGSDWNEIL